MFEQPLWPNPDLDKLRSTAKLIRDAVRAEDHDALAMVRQFHPHLADLTPADDRTATFRLSDAQLTLARIHGLRSWPELVRHVKLVRDIRRNPHRGDPDSDVDRLVRLACLNYGTDDPRRWREAQALLAAEPSLGEATWWSSATVGNVALLHQVLDEGWSPNETGGPFDWPPLLYATYARLPQADTLPAIEFLLEAGADPNAGFLWEGLVPPFTALTGVLGGGEGHQPPHPRWPEAARALLRAGADPNDAQAIYNRGPGDRPSDDTAFLALLIEYGFGRGDGGPWFHRLAPRHPTPQQLMSEALQHAAEQGLIERARLLLDQGADPNGHGQHPIFAGRTAYQGAVAAGHRHVEDLLAERGADTATVDAPQRLVGALLAGDITEVNRVRRSTPSLIADVVRGDPALIARAAKSGRADSISLLAGAGFRRQRRPNHRAARSRAARSGSRRRTPARTRGRPDRRRSSLRVDSGRLGPPWRSPGAGRAARRSCSGLGKYVAGRISGLTTGDSRRTTASGPKRLATGLSLGGFRGDLGIQPVELSVGDAIVLSLP